MHSVFHSWTQGFLRTCHCSVFLAWLVFSIPSCGIFCPDRTSICTYLCPLSNFCVPAPSHVSWFFLPPHPVYFSQGLFLQNVSHFKGSASDFWMIHLSLTFFFFKCIYMKGSQRPSIQWFSSQIAKKPGAWKLHFCLPLGGRGSSTWGFPSGVGKECSRWNLNWHRYRIPVSQVAAQRAVLHQPTI